MNLGTPFGLALSSGINAYLPLLSFAIASRWFKLYKVNPNFPFITQNWFMIALAILALGDLFADKIPIVDHIWDAINTLTRPIAGAIVAAASINQLTIASLIGSSHIATTGNHMLSAGLTESLVVAVSGSQISTVGLIITLVIGGTLAAMVHTTKAGVRIVSTTTTIGSLNIILSIVEDFIVVIGIILSLLLPVIM